MQKVVLCITLLVAMSIAAEMIEFTENWAPQPLYTVVSQSPGGVDLVFSMHEMVVEEQVIDGVPMRSYGVPAVFIAEPGKPNLNAVSRYVALPEGARVRITVHDVMGREVALVADGEYTAGEFPVTWDGAGDNGERVGPGIYFVVAEAGDQRAVRKLVCLR